MYLFPLKFIARNNVDTDISLNETIYKRNCYVLLIFLTWVSNDINKSNVRDRQNDNKKLYYYTKKASSPTW